MSYDPKPSSFFGPTITYASDQILLNTADKAGVTIDDFTATADSSLLTISPGPHNLKVGDKVAISNSGGGGEALPAPFTAGDYFVVSIPTDSTTQFSLSATAGGTAIVATDTGTGTHTVKALSALREVTSAEAGETADGDWRKVVFGLMEMLYQKWTGTATADRPTKMNISRSSGVDEATGNITRYYSVQIIAAPSGLEVTNE